jgi:D-arginine dehydrogenase
MIFDVAIIGAGIAGASVAASLDPEMNVVLIEAETQAGYHSTGRSASFWDECYGGPQVQPLTTASGPFLSAPPASFSERGFLSPRGVLYISRDVDSLALAEMTARFKNSGVALRSVSAAEVQAFVPGIKPEWSHALYGSACADIDVASLHGAYLRQARQSGVQLLLGAPVIALRRSDGIWQIETSAGPVSAKLIVNAGGAWVDEIAKFAGVRPLGITPYRRTISQVRVAPLASADIPLVIDINGAFYFKPETGGKLWISPHDETLTPACDAAPEELDIAMAIDRFENATDYKVEAVDHSWAGLRSFAPDRLPVFGFDPDEDSFFWCAGQGGFGIQTAPAAAELCATLITGRTPSASLALIDAELYKPERFR